MSTAAGRMLKKAFSKTRVKSKLLPLAGPNESSLASQESLRPSS